MVHPGCKQGTGSDDQATCDHCWWRRKRRTSRLSIAASGPQGIPGDADPVVAGARVPQLDDRGGALGFRRHPGLSHGAIDDVSLSPFAPWASKGSQVLAQRAWLNRRQPHWSTASSALRALVLCVEHGCPFSSGP